MGLSYQTREKVRKFLPLALVAGLAYGAYQISDSRAFKRGIGPGLTQMVHNIPYFGARFKKYEPRKSYKKHYRKGKRKYARSYARKGKRHTYRKGKGKVRRKYVRRRARKRR